MERTWDNSRQALAGKEEVMAIPTIDMVMTGAQISMSA